MSIRYNNAGKTLIVDKIIERKAIKKQSVEKKEQYIAKAALLANYEKLKTEMLSYVSDNYLTSSEKFQLMKDMIGIDTSYANLRTQSQELKFNLSTSEYYTDYLEYVNNYNELKDFITPYLETDQAESIDSELFQVKLNSFYNALSNLEQIVFQVLYSYTKSIKIELTSEFFVFKDSVTPAYHQTIQAKLITWDLIENTQFLVNGNIRIPDNDNIVNIELSDIENLDEVTLKFISEDLEITRKIRKIFNGEKGLQGLQGQKGEQGIPGNDGTNGLTAYNHIAYADDSSGNGFSQSPTGKKYVGFYSDHTSRDNTNASCYNWSLIKGLDGTDGLPGQKGDDGLTAYFHTAWANSPDGSSDFSTSISSNKLYIGTYSDNTLADSNNYAVYNWIKIKGEPGNDGKDGAKGDKGDKGDTGNQGPQGNDGSVGETGKLTVEYSNNIITVKPLQNIGFIKYNGVDIIFNETSKSFTSMGEGIIIARLDTNEIKFCKLELGNTTYNNNSVKTINVLDFEDNTLITTRHYSMNNYAFVKIGEFVLTNGGTVLSAAITSIETIDLYFQKAFMKIFKSGSISTNEFEDWLEALDLKNFYQTLVISNLFVNSILANDGQFLNSLRISKDNIEGEINENINVQGLFQGGLNLNSDGSIAANWSGLDTNGYPKSGWKINGDGQSFFKGATIIDANVQGLTADQISHDALRTVDEKNGDTIDYSLSKNEWLSNNFLSQLDRNNFSQANYNISCDGISYDYFLKTDNSNQYFLYDTNSYSTNIAHGDNETLHTWTNTYGYPLYAEVKATLGGTSNEIVWEVINGSNPRRLCRETGINTSFIIQPGETLRCRGHSWALWGDKDAYVNYVKFYKTSNSGKEHPIYSLHEDVYIYETGPQSENVNTTKTICIKTIPAYADYVYIFFAKKGSSSITFYDCNNHKTHWYYSVNGGSQIQITPVLTADENFCGWVKIDCRSYTSDITLRFFISLSSSYSSSNESWKRSQIKIDLLDYLYTVDLTANANGYALYSKTSRTKKYFKNNTYYKNNLAISSDSSSNHLTKVNKADFVSGLYNSIATELRDNWLILTDVANKHYLLIDGVHTYIVQLFITSSYIKVMLTSGQIATLIQDTRYSSLSIYSIVAGSVESIETGHIIPKTTNRVIGQAGKEFQSAHINVITAPIIYSSSTTGYFKGKVYAG